MRRSKARCVDHIITIYLCMSLDYSSIIVKTKTKPRSPAPNSLHRTLALAPQLSPINHFSLPQQLLRQTKVCPRRCHAGGGGKFSFKNQAGKKNGDFGVHVSEAACNNSPASLLPIVTFDLRPRRPLTLAPVFLDGSWRVSKTCRVSLGSACKGHLR